MKVRRQASQRLVVDLNLALVTFETHYIIHFVHTIRSINTKIEKKEQKIYVMNNQSLDKKTAKINKYSLN